VNGAVGRPPAIRTGRSWRLARVLTVTSGLVAVTCVVLLIGQYAVGTRQAADEQARIEALEAQTATDPEAATRLDSVREQATEASVAREDRARWLAWGLLVAGALFLVGARWLRAPEPGRSPSLETLVQVRDAEQVPSAPGRKLGSGRPRAAADAGVDLGVVDELVNRFGQSREAAIPILQAIQDHFRYLPDEALARVCERTEITAAQIAGTSSFYAQFRRSPVGRNVLRICHGTACHVAGAEQVTRELRRPLEIPPGADTDPRRLFTLEAVACVGCCSLAPVMMIEDETVGHLTPASARQTVDAMVDAS
jgi:NADH:ubiquinone oxidoreductase subunit E